MKDSDFIWMAGVTDSVGSIRFDKRKRLILQYHVARRPEVFALLEAMGLPLSNHKADIKSLYRKACKEHCPEAHVHVVLGKTPIAPRVCLWDSSAFIVLWNIFPHLRVLKDEVGRCMDLYKLTRKGTYSSPVVDALMAAGWEFPDELPIPRRGHSNHRTAVRGWEEAS